MPETCILYRTKGPSWTFTWGQFGFSRVTRNLTVYRIVPQSRYRGLWIGMLTSNGHLVTVEKRIGASSLHFPDGGRYIFPGQHE